MCEVPGWGLRLEPDRVLAEMQELGVAATEAGPDGYLGSVSEARASLARHRLQLVGGFLPVVLHEPGLLEASLAKVRRTAALFADLGASVLCSAAVVDDGWSPRRELDDGEWEHLLHGLAAVDDAAAEFGITQVLHPHWSTLIERADDVKRVLEGSDVRICLDTGHLVLGGADPLEVAESFPARIGHVHLKDVRIAVAERLRAGELGLVESVQHGLFKPLGAGDVAIGDVIVALERSGYGGWYVLEQDTAIAETPPPGMGPVENVGRSVAYLANVVESAVPSTVVTERR